MKIIQRSRINYKSLGNLTCYTGPMSSGLTLASVINIVKLHKLYPEKKIISNIKLPLLPHEGFTFSNIDNYINSIILIDATYMFMDRRMYNKSITSIGIKFTHQLRSRNNFMVINSSRLEYIEPKIRVCITDCFACNHFNNEYKTPCLGLTKLESRWKEPYRIEYKPFRVRKYYKQYNTIELPKVPKLVI